MPRLSYPYTGQFGSSAQTLEFTDGLEITIPSGTFSSTFTATITKHTDTTSIDGYPPVTAGYEITTPTQGGVTADRQISLEIPTTVPVSASDDPKNYLNVTSYIDPLGWTPSPIAVTVRSSSVLLTKIERFTTFRVVKTANLR